MKFLTHFQMFIKNALERKIFINLQLETQRVKIFNKKYFLLYFIIPRDFYFERNIKKILY